MKSNDEFLKRLEQNRPSKEKKSTDTWQSRIGCMGGMWFTVIYLGILGYTFFTDTPLSDGFLWGGLILTSCLLLLGQYGISKEASNRLENAFGIKKSEWIYIGKYAEGTSEKYKNYPIYAAVKNNILFLCYNDSIGLDLMSKIPFDKIGYVSCTDFRHTEERYWGNVEYRSIWFKNVRHHKAVYDTVTKGSIEFSLIWGDETQTKNLMCIVPNEHIMKQVNKIITQIEQKNE